MKNMLEALIVNKNTKVENEMILYSEERYLYRLTVHSCSVFKVSGQINRLASSLCLVLPSPPWSFDKPTRAAFK